MDGRSLRLSTAQKRGQKGNDANFSHVTSVALTARVLKCAKLFWNQVHTAETRVSCFFFLPLSLVSLWYEFECIRYRSSSLCVDPLYVNTEKIPLTRVDNVCRMETTEKKRVAVGNVQILK